MAFEKRSLSIGSAAGKFELLMYRFPISALLVTALTVLIFQIIGDVEKIESLSYKIFIFLPLGAVISAAAALWLEDFVSRAKQHIITAAITLLWGVYCFFLPAKALGAFGPEYFINWGWEVCAIGTAAFLAIFFISFLKRDRDGAFWNFSAQTVWQLFVACCFGAILNTGLCGAFWAAGALLEVKISAEICWYVSAACNAFFVPLYFLANIPDKTAKHNGDVVPNKVMEILGLYILTPLAAVYAVILYMYLFKIIVIWELPKGLVSWLVSVLACGGLVRIMLLYPTAAQEKNKTTGRLSRYFGLMLLPLLALMSIGIFRRIGDYGVTVLRVYLLLINMWFYGIYIHIFITKAQRIKWIPISFAVFVLFSSFGFWGVPNVTRHILVAEVKRSINANRIEEKNIRDKVEYLRGTYGKESLRPLLGAAAAIRDSGDIRVIRELLPELNSEAEMEPKPKHLKKKRPPNCKKPDIKWYSANPKATEFTISTACELEGFAQIVNGTWGGKPKSDTFSGKTVRLAADIDLAGYDNWAPIGRYKNTGTLGTIYWLLDETPAEYQFFGTFDGGGRVISNLTINRPYADYQGLFGRVVDGGRVKNLKLDNVNIRGGHYVGSVAGYVKGGYEEKHLGGGSRVDSCSSAGEVSGKRYVGGVVGELCHNSNVTNSDFTGAVSGANDVGGVAGMVGGSSEGENEVANSYSAGTVSGNDYVGGVAGYLFNGNVINCYSASTVSGNEYVGGVAGQIYPGNGIKGSSVIGCYSTGAVTGKKSAGGVAGEVYYEKNSNLINSVALNPRVSGTPIFRKVNRVAGSSWNSSKLSNNAAWAQMTVEDNGKTVWSGRSADGAGGADITTAQIHADPTLGGRFKAEDGWTILPGKLPGLRGEAVEMPEHLR